MRTGKAFFFEKAALEVEHIMLLVRSRPPEQLGQLELEIRLRLQWICEYTDEYDLVNGACRAVRDALLGRIVAPTMERKRQELETALKVLRVAVRSARRAWRIAQKQADAKQAHASTGTLAAHVTPVDTLPVSEQEHVAEG